MSMKRVLFLGNDVTYFLTHRLPMAKAALEAGYDVHVAAPLAEGTDLIRAEGLIYHPIHLTRWGGQPISELRSLWSIYQLFRELKPDLVHQVTIKPVIYGGLMARLAGVPSLVSAVSGLGYMFLQRGIKGKIMREGAKIAYRMAFAHPRAKVIFQNQDDRADFVNSGLVPNRKTSLVRGSGVDVEMFNVTPESTDQVTVVLPSRMLWDKGVKEFVEAAGILNKERRRARFVLVGVNELGNPASVPSKTLSGWHDSGVIEWWGYRQNMSEILSQAHIVCLPSYREGVPKALIEAAACGRAIVTTDVPGCREIVRDGWNGLLVPARDSRSLAEAIGRLIEDSSMRARFSANGRELAVSEFSVERVVRETLDIYSELLS